MRRGSALILALSVCGVCLGGAFGTPRALAQTAARERPRLKEFGNSLGTLTGGWADFLEEPAQAAAIYERIFADVGLRYVVGFYPTNKARDGGRRRMNIEVRGHPEYTVWGRKAYYAPGPDDQSRGR